MKSNREDESLIGKEWRACRVKESDTTGQVFPIRSFLYLLYQSNLIDHDTKLKELWEYLSINEPVPSIDFVEHVVLVRLVPFEDTQLELKISELGDSLNTFIVPSEYPKGHWWNTYVILLLKRNNLVWIDKCEVVDYTFRYGADHIYYPPIDEFRCSGSLLSMYNDGINVGINNSIREGYYSTIFLGKMILPWQYKDNESPQALPVFSLNNGQDSLCLSFSYPLEFEVGHVYDIFTERRQGWPSTYALLVKENDTLLFQGITDWEIGYCYKLEDLSPFTVVEKELMSENYYINPHNLGTSYNVKVGFVLNGEEVILYQGQTIRHQGYKISLLIAREENFKNCLDCGTNDISYTIEKLSNKPPIQTSP